MIRSSANNSHTDPVPLIPASIAINDIDPVAGIQVVNGAFSIDSPDLGSYCQKRGLKRGTRLEDKIRHVGCFAKTCKKPH